MIDGGLMIVAGIMVLAFGISLIQGQRQINSKFRQPKYKNIRGVWTRIQ
jgi:hypothetical protein